MSTDEDISLQDIQRCVRCSSAVLSVVMCRNTACPFSVTAHECQLYAYAKNGSMKFCYACGGTMETREDSHMVCNKCTDTIKFKEATKKLNVKLIYIDISANDVKHCVVCAGAMETKSSGKMYCSKQKCKFRLMDTDSKMVTKTLQECSAKGKVKFCYGCGCSVMEEGKCTRESCSTTARLPSDEQLANCGEENQLDSNSNVALKDRPPAASNVAGHDGRALVHTVHASCTINNDNGAVKSYPSKTTRGNEGEEVKDKYVLSREAVSLMNIKYCVICLSQVSQAVTCQNTACCFKVAGDKCEPQLYAYAEKASMRFCYACGSNMELEDNLIVCSTCTDSIKFELCGGGIPGNKEEAEDTIAPRHIQ